MAGFAPTWLSAGTDRGERFRDSGLVIRAALAAPQQAQGVRLNCRKVLRSPLSSVGKYDPLCGVAAAHLRFIVYSHVNLSFYNLLFTHFYLCLMKMVIALVRLRRLQ